MLRDAGGGDDDANDGVDDAGDSADSDGDDGNGVVDDDDDGDELQYDHALEHGLEYEHDHELFPCSKAALARVAI